MVTPNNTYFSHVATVKFVKPQIVRELMITINPDLLHLNQNSADYTETHNVLCIVGIFKFIAHIIILRTEIRTSCVVHNTNGNVSTGKHSYYLL